ncbi:MAG: MFS transporter [Elusimicrobia bacterium]|nr:MFS transporter [Elusimicrobiota bacterium]
MPGFDSLYLFCAVNYFAQGMAGIVYEPVNYLLKDGLKLSAGQTAVFVAWMTAPFLIKPLFGLLTDLVRLPGGLRRPHLVLGALLGSVCWIILALHPTHRYAPLLILLAAVNFSVVFCDVVCDGVMVETGKAAGKTGTYQAVQIGTLYATLVLTGLGGGWLSAHASMRTVFALAAVFPLLIAGSAIWVKELPAREPAREGARNLLGLMREKSFWALCLMIFLWSFYPFLGSAQFYYQSEALHLGPVYIGALSTMGGAAGMAGAAFFGTTIRRWGTGRFLRFGILVSGATSLLYLLYLGPVSAGVLTVLFGFLGVVFRLALMDLAAQSCPKHAEATAFAVYMAVFNLAALGSNTVGGTLYDKMKLVFAAAGNPSYCSAAVLILIGSACTFACWWLLPAVVGAREQTPLASEARGA